MPSVVFFYYSTYTLVLCSLSDNIFFAARAFVFRITPEDHQEEEKETLLRSRSSRERKFTFVHWLCCAVLCCSVDATKTRRACDVGTEGWVSRFFGSSEIRALSRQRVDVIVVSATRTIHGAAVGILFFVRSSVLLV